MKRFWLIICFSLTLPLATQATGPSVYVDLDFKAVTITDDSKEKISEDPNGKMIGTVNDQAYTKEWYFTTE